MVKNTELYDLLNISPSATQQEVKKSYKLAALKYHPDKNGHSESSKQHFQKISDAYRVLSDNRLRNLYDKYGCADEKQIASLVATETQKKYESNEIGGFSAGELFSHFFGGGNTSSDFPLFSTNISVSRSFNVGLQGEDEDVSRGVDIRHKMKCTLQELYNGKVAKLALTRTRICKKCLGQGGQENLVCFMCNGKRVLSQTKRRGAVVRTWSMMCKGCEGSGKLVVRNNVCKPCQGEGYIKERKIFKVEAKPGMGNGSEIVFPGEADEVVNTVYGKQRVIPGDLIISIQEVFQPHCRYKRHSKLDLVLSRFCIPFRTALCGGTMFIEDHPSGVPIKIEVPPCELLKPGTVKCIKNLGMPKFEIFTSYGDLYVEFFVEFPKKLAPKSIQQMLKILDEDPYTQEQRASSIFSSNVQGYKECSLSDFIDEDPSLERNLNTCRLKTKKKRRKYFLDDNGVSGYSYEDEDDV